VFGFGDSLCGGGNGILVGQKTQVKNHALLVYYIMRYVCDIYARDEQFGNSLRDHHKYVRQVDLIILYVIRSAWS